MTNDFINCCLKKIEILDDESLYRRIHPDHKKPDGRPSSAAFKDPNMSVDVARLTKKEAALSSFPRYGLVSIKAGYARSLKQKVFHDPTKSNPAHAIVQGKKTDSIAKRLAESASPEI